MTTHEIKSLTMTRGEEPANDGAVTYTATMSCVCGFISPPYKTPALAFALGAVSVLCDMYPPPLHEKRSITGEREKAALLESLPGPASRERSS